jgi:cell division protein FtsB
MADTPPNPTSESADDVKRRRDRRLSSVQIMFAVILSVGLMLALQFSNRIQADRDLQRIHDQVVQEIEFLEQQQAELMDEINYVKSDAYVERWARDEGKMVREGEVLVLPQPLERPAEAQATPIPLVAFETTPPEPQNWELWWALFFDTPPPF